MITATVICDASFCHNQKVGGWAAWVRIDGVAEPIKGYGTIKSPMKSSTHAEGYAALNGIWMARQYGASRILVRSDNMCVVNALDKSKPMSTIERWLRLRAKEIDFDLTGIRSQHVKAHGDASRSAAAYVNDWCDKHAGLAMREARKQKKVMEIAWA